MLAHPSAALLHSQVFGLLRETLAAPFKPLRLGILDEPPVAPSATRSDACMHADARGRRMHATRGGRTHACAARVVIDRERARALAHRVARLAKAVLRPTAEQKVSMGVMVELVTMLRQASTEDKQVLRVSCGHAAMRLPSSRNRMHGHRHRHTATATALTAAAAATATATPTRARSSL